MKQYTSQIFISPFVSPMMLGTHAREKENQLVQYHESCVFLSMIYGAEVHALKPWQPLCRWLTLFLSSYVTGVDRVLGGLLSAYDLTAEKMFLTKAKEIADRLLPAWDTRTGIPYTTINLDSGRAHNPGWTGVSYICVSHWKSLCAFLLLCSLHKD